MENKVVARCARYISEAGIEAIRFNFRGVGQSEGSFDSGCGEREDLLAVIDYVSRTSPAARIAVVGFSFGAWIGLDVGERDGRVQALVGLAPPVRMFGIEPVATSSKPKLLVYAENDQFTPAAATRAWTESSHQPIESVCIPGVDHFFGHQVDMVGQKVAEFLMKVL
jgi:alpha/beta superfamily hydrolase